MSTEAKTVYIAEVYGYEWGRVLGIMSTREKAEEVINTYVKNHGLDYGDETSITEAVIDEYIPSVSEQIIRERKSGK